MVVSWITGTELLLMSKSKQEVGKPLSVDDLLKGIHNQIEDNEKVRDLSIINKKVGKLFVVFGLECAFRLKAAKQANVIVRESISNYAGRVVCGDTTVEEFGPVAKALLEKAQPASWPKPQFYEELWAYYQHPAGRAPEGNLAKILSINRQSAASDPQQPLSSG